MKKDDLIFVKKILESIKNKDEQVAKAISFVDRDIKIYDARKGSWRSQVEYDRDDYPF